jgi:hypothetical protein
MRAIAASNENRLPAHDRAKESDRKVKSGHPSHLARMQVGVNYPWFDYGWDFGAPPPTWRDDQPRWVDHIDADLHRLHDLGISVVRWFVLADGLTYGTGGQAPWQDGFGWHFSPPPMDEQIGRDFERLLEAVDRFNAAAVPPIRLLPVLIDFPFALPGAPIEQPHPFEPGMVVETGWVKQGRHEALATDADRSAFLTATLDPLLAISQRHADAIYAWESINEPDWITNGWHPDGRSSHPVADTAMQAFVEDAAARIDAAGFKSTIGFSLLETLAGSGITAEVNQFHHYPNGARLLPPHTFDPEFPAIIGEFATVPADVWPELPEQTIFARLRQAERQGYPLALLWSFRQRDRHAEWTAEVEADLLRFRERPVRSRKRRRLASS